MFLVDFFEVVSKRKSIRKFKPIEVPLDLIEKCIDAARLAPSSLNRQTWHFLVIRKPDLKKQVRQLYINARKKLGLYEQDTIFLENATLILVCSSSKENWDLLSIPLAVENIVLAATALDLASIAMVTPVSTTEQLDFYRKQFGIPESFEILLMIAIGYADEIPQPKQKKALNEIIHFDKF